MMSTANAHTEIRAFLGKLLAEEGQLPSTCDETFGLVAQGASMSKLSAKKLAEVSTVEGSGSSDPHNSKSISFYIRETSPLTAEQVEVLLKDEHKRFGLRKWFENRDVGRGDGVVDSSGRLESYDGEDDEDDNDNDNEDKDKDDESGFSIPHYLLQEGARWRARSAGVTIAGTPADRLESDIKSTFMALSTKYVPSL
ncbi:unnamed protein product [Sympodiomycopsis kandeliae]